MALKKDFCYGFLKYFLFFLLFVVLQFAEIKGVHPFAYGMIFALVWCNQKIYFLVPLYILSGLCYDLSLFNFLNLFCTCFVFVFFYFLHYKLKKPLNSIFIGLYALLSQSPYLLLNSYDSVSFVNSIISVLIGLVCLFAYLYFMQSLLIKGVRRNYTLDEMICAGVFLIAIGCGASSIPDYNQIFSKTIFLFLCIVLVTVFESSGIIFSVLLGLGDLISSQNFDMFVTITLISLVLSLTKNSKKIFQVLSLILVDAFVNLYLFNDYNFLKFLPILLSLFVFLLIPTKWFKKLQQSLISEKEEYSLRNFINKSRQIVSEKLLKVDEIFKEMQNIYLKMTKKSLNVDDAIKLLTNEVKKSCCQNCPQKSDCLSFNMINNNDIENLIGLAISRGKISFFDVSSTLLKNCEKINVLVNSINNLTKEYNQYAIVSNGMNNSRLLIAEQLSGVRQILYSVGDEIKKTVTFDLGLEKKIIELLLYEQILCSEAVVYLKEQKIDSISLIVKNGDADAKKIAKLVSKLTKMRLDVNLCTPSQKAGFMLIVLKEAYFYDVVFGSSFAIKNGSIKSGDTFSVKRIGKEKVFMSVCDGMGSGPDAHNVSELSLNLIEKFYLAGFETNLIISNVNKLLSLKDEENFSAIDICVFDLKEGSCEITKLGATVGFIKKKDTTILVKASSLPLGILESVNPAFDYYALNDNDMVILLSDGVVDVFDDVKKLQDFINNTKTENPQILADKILAESLKISKNYANDDMTVLVGKIWQKV
ncbi:MAG: SpoIIE family protein phosphatase [Clostridia bacterium]|nr:SpoIIE family protein phosphatase [Clostridia bacterium]